MCCEQTLFCSDAYCDDGAGETSITVQRLIVNADAYLPSDGDVALDEGDAETGRACWTSFSTFLDD